MTITANAVPPTSTAQNVLALIARLLLAALFILAGINKIGAMEGTVGYISSVGMPFPELVYFGTVAFEIVGGLMLAAGFKARYVGFGFWCSGTKRRFAAAN